MRAPLLRGSLCAAVVVITAVACNGGTYSKRQLIAGIDDFCKCTGLQRKSGLLSLARDGESAIVMLSADGVSEKYSIEFVDGHPATFGPVNYKPHWGEAMDLQHFAELDSQSAIRWEKDGSLVVQIETIVDGNEGSVTATRTVVLALDRSDKAKVRKSTTKFAVEKH